MAKSGDPYAIDFPKVYFKDSPYDFSFSGVKTAVINYSHNAEQAGRELNKADVAASFSRAVCTVLTEKATAAVKDLSESLGAGKRLVVAGGVSANSVLRSYLARSAEKNGFDLYLPPLSLCGDNAAMIASQGYYEYLAGNVANETLNAYATKSIETNAGEE